MMSIESSTEVSDFGGMRVLTRAHDRHQTLQYPCQHRGRNQDLRLWRLGRIDQFDRKHLCRHKHVYEREFDQNCSPTSSLTCQPERIQGAPYTIKSDVWSLGISLIELALGRFPFSDSPESDTEYDPDPTLPISSQRPKVTKHNGDKGVSLGGGGHTMSILDLLQHIVNEPAPRLVSSKREFPAEAVTFIEGCLDKDPTPRKSPQQLLVSGGTCALVVALTDSSLLRGSPRARSPRRTWRLG